MAEYLTPEGLEKFKKELDHLENVKRQEISERIRYTAAFGDLKENAAYHEAKDAQGFLEGRIRELKGIMANAKVLKNNGEAAKSVQLGSTVALKSADGQEEFRLVCPEEADILESKISYKSPLGAVLMGKKKGSKIAVKTPGGRVEYEVLEIK